MLTVEDGLKQLKQRLDALGIRSIMTTIKRWIWVFSTGLAIGLVLGQQSTYWSIIKDCKVMGMFRVGQAPISCTYHLVEVKK
jgi:hypothetical protein